MSSERSRNRRGPSPLIVAGVVLVAMGCLVGAVSPFVDDPRVFVMMLGGTFACAIGLWLVVRLIGYSTNPNRQLDPGLIDEEITGIDS